MSRSALPTVSRHRCSEEASPADIGLLRTRGYELCKRSIDIVVSLTLLVVLSPLLLAVAAGVKLSSPGPIIFRQRRLCRGGAVFSCFKFRTMVRDAEKLLQKSKDLSVLFGENYKIVDDPRITPFGALLRTSSLDELPQLWNVLRGEMTLIGPRPIVEPELAKYGVHAGRLLTVKPGLGGVWQVNGRSDTTYDERIAMDMGYIESRSFWLDLRLMLLTAFVVLRGRGAY